MIYKISPHLKISPLLNARLANYFEKMQNAVANVANGAGFCDFDKSNADSCLNHTQSFWQMEMEELEKWGVSLEEWWWNDNSSEIFEN